MRSLGESREVAVLKEWSFWGLLSWWGSSLESEGFSGRGAVLEDWLLG